jgi:glyoxylase-like metal-dependent hydrolase (beta-lactamase superfamily II)
LLLTHSHLDHIFGNKHVFEKYGLRPELHRDELPMLQTATRIAEMYGLRIETSPEPENFIQAGEDVTFGKTTFQTLLTPGHSPASISFYVKEEDYVIAGDVLFRESIGRTDLPGGDFNTLITSIKEQLFSLPDHTRIYPGHGPATTIAHEKRNNPFLR